MTEGLSFLDVSRRFGVHSALAGLELDCPPGAMTCLVGPNGAGKSTALALAAGLLAPTSGQVHVDGVPVDSKAAPRSTGYLPQRSAFHRSLLVEEVVSFTAAARAAAADEVVRALQVTGLDEVMERFVGGLSGGWVRRLGLFSALLASPGLLLLDEPFVGLDPETNDRLLAYLHRCLDSGVAVVVASHDFEVLDPCGPRVAVLDEGRLIGLETLPADGTGSSRAVYRRQLGCEPLVRAAGGGGS